MLVGLHSCPHCQSENVATEWREVEEIMGKISKAQGATRFTPEPATYDAFTLNEVGGEPAEVEQAEQVDYTTWTVAELKTELDKRVQAYANADEPDAAEAVSYTSSAKKDDLVTLLQLDDEPTQNDDEE